MSVERILLTSSVADHYLNPSSFLPIHLLLSVHKLTSLHLHTTNSALLPLFAWSRHSLEENRKGAEGCLWLARRFHIVFFHLEVKRVKETCSNLTTNCPSPSGCGCKTHCAGSPNRLSLTLD